MNLEDSKRLHEALVIPSQGTGSPFRELLEKMFEVVIRLDRESVLGMNYDHRAGQNGGYTNSFKSYGISMISGTLNRLDSDVPNFIDTPLCPSSFKRGQRSSEDLLNAAGECYLEGVSTRDSGKNYVHIQISTRNHKVPILPVKLPKFKVSKRDNSNSQQSHFDNST